jgi:hypothetical protein
VSSASTSGASSGASSGTSSGRGALVIILTVIGILAIIAGILYVSGAANSIHFMVSVRHGHHQVRAIVAFVIGIACLIGAYIAHTRPAPGARPSASAAGAGGGSASASGTGSGSASPSETGSGSPSGTGSGGASPSGTGSGSASPSGTGSDGGSGSPSPSGS